MVEYNYKPDGLRYSKTVDGITTTHIWDGQNMVAELDNSGQVQDVYTRGLSLIKSNENGYYVYNGHGDVVGLTNSNGQVTNAYDYDAFGVAKDEDESDTNPFRYCGEYWDKETGDVYLRNRYYNPVIGQFMSEDPIRDGYNWYNYCNGNPILYKDAEELKPEKISELVDGLDGIYFLDTKNNAVKVAIGEVINTYFQDGTNSSEAPYRGTNSPGITMNNGDLYIDGEWFAKGFGAKYEEFEGVGFQGFNISKTFYTDKSKFSASGYSMDTTYLSIDNTIAGQKLASNINSYQNSVANTRLVLITTAGGSGIDFTTKFRKILFGGILGGNLTTANSDFSNKFQAGETLISKTRVGFSGTSRPKTTIENTIKSVSGAIRAYFKSTIS